MTAIHQAVIWRLQEIGIGWTTAKSDLEAIRLFAAEGKLLLVVHTASKVAVAAIDLDQPLNPERFTR